MSSHDLRDRLDGLDGYGSQELLGGGLVGGCRVDCSPAMYKRAVKKKVDRRGRFRTQPVTFSEIKEVDEEKVEDPLIAVTTTTNTTDIRDSSDKSRSEIDLNNKENTDLKRSHSCRRQKRGSRSVLCRMF